MSAVCSVVDVSSWPVHRDETVGSKRKVWLRDAQDRRWLFKYKHRDWTGDDWAEKVAAGIAEALGIAHAHTELAEYHGHPGVVSLDFTENRTRGHLVLGNELLQKVDRTYPRGERMRPVQHTVEAVVEVLGQEIIGIDERARRPGVVDSASDVFLGYLLLDALIGNTDRHHENWGVLETKAADGAGRAVLAPSFDHASSFGHGLKDAEREARLSTKDRAYTIEAWTARGRSALYDQGDPPRLLRLREAFGRAALYRPDAARSWLRQLRTVSPDALAAPLEALPEARATDPARLFARRVVECNRMALLDSKL